MFYQPGTSLFTGEGAQATGHAGHDHQAERPEQSRPIARTPPCGGEQELKAQAFGHAGHGAVPLRRQGSIS